MKIKSSLLATFALPCIGLLPASAAITYDGFDYGVGTTLEASVEWIPLNTGTAPVIASGSLSVPGLATSTGNKVSFASGNIQEALGALDSITTGSVFYSFAFALTSAPTTANYSFALSTTNTTYGSVVFLQASGAGFNIGLSNRSSGSTVVYSPTVYTLNTTIFLVGAYDFVTGTGNDTSRLWINPTSFGAGTSAVVPAATLSSSGGTDVSSISQFLLRGAAGSPAGEMDELRIGSSFSAVTIPEPNAALVLGSFGLLGILRRRR